MDSASSIYGCYNRADFKKKFSVQDGWQRMTVNVYADYRKINVRIDAVICDTSTKHCVYTLTNQSDPNCIGCSRHASQQVKP